MFEYGESLTAAIRHPRTAGAIGAARSGAFMRWQLPDPELRRRVWPDYPFGCKRVLFSSLFLPVLARPNVELVTEPIVRVARDGVVTGDGELHELDCIIWATGFRTNDFMLPMAIAGADGRTLTDAWLHELDCIIWATGFRTNDFMLPMAIAGADGRTLTDAWSGGPHAHLGMTVPGFPNMFILYGPNTNTSGGSIIFYLETQSAYVRQALEQMRDRGADAIEVRREVEAASDEAVQAAFAGTAWTQCDSWYRDAQGRIVANWPGYMREYAEQAATPVAGDFRFLHAGDRSALAEA
jgi:cation diffusion facilitator CzcD-associated flavoprotein CzcO